MNTLKVLFVPAEFEALTPADLTEATCVVFDVLRATSTMVAALNNGALGIVPVATIEAAVRLHELDRDVLLAGERHGIRIRAAQTGGIDFAFGNSPREFTADKVARKTIVTTTTNGTRALRACLGAENVFAASFANLNATAARIRDLRPDQLLLVCSGTGSEVSFEDALCAGALADLLWNDTFASDHADSAHIARSVYRKHQNDLEGAMQHASNARRLLALPDLAADVDFCLDRDTADFAAVLGSDGTVRKAQPFL
ncbi:MAG: comB [Verrucomicrobiales bacterium]|nr:comB [Verrucomicrobiales bacterium]